MNKYIKIFLFFCLVEPSPVLAHSWNLVSPDHEQTFSYGTEQHRVWVKTDQTHALTLRLDYTNDPYVSRSEPRQYDHFAFHFPEIVLAKDGTTFCYVPKQGPPVPVARIKPDFLGVDEIHLTPYARVAVETPHGYITVRLYLFDRPLASSEED